MNLIRSTSYEESLVSKKILSKGQVKEIRRMFELVDVDKDEKLTIIEVGKLILKITNSKDFLFPSITSELKSQNWMHRRFWKPWMSTKMVWLNGNNF